MLEGGGGGEGYSVDRVVSDCAGDIIQGDMLWWHCVDIPFGIWFICKSQAISELASWQLYHEKDQ